MALTDVWFLLIAVLWIGYFILEGFDFGVGMLLPVLGRAGQPDSDTRRRMLLNAIGPVWDGNEVWLLVAGGATFAAFPEWYASMFSGFYLALLLILVALIGRGVAFEYRSKVDSARWRRTWDRVIVVGSAVPAILWGVAFGNIVHGVPLDAQHHVTGTLLTLLNPFALLGGITTGLLFLTHGAIFLALKTEAPVRAAARRVAQRTGIAAVVAAAAFLLWSQLANGDGLTWVTTAVAAFALIGALLLNNIGREGWSFGLLATTLLVAVATLFLQLYPNVLPSSTDPAFSLTVHNASSTPYTLKIMTVVAGIFTPIVLLYQGFTYWVFRKRVSVRDIPVTHP